MPTVKKSPDNGDSTQANLSFLASIVRSSDDAVEALDLDGKVLVWNRGCEELYGYTQADMAGKSVVAVFPENRADELKSIISKIKDGEHVAAYVSQRIRKDGVKIDVAISASPILDDAGKIIAVSIISRPFAGQERVEQYASSLARSVIEAGLDPMITISPEGKVTDVNEATVHITGVPREKLIGSDFVRYFTEPEEALRGNQQVFKEGFIREYPLIVRHVSGALTDVLYNASVYKDDKGNVFGAIAAVRDVTASKQALFYARSVIEAGLDPMITISPEGKVTDVNEATVHITGVTREKLIGSDFISYFTDPEEALQGNQQVFKEGFIREYPLIVRHVSGALTDVLYNASVYKDDKGKVFGAIAAVRDVTAQKKVEEKLHETSAYAQSLVEASLDPLFVISPEGRITGVNHATEGVTGVTREWLVDTDFSRYFTEPHKARDGYRKVLKEGEVRDYPLAIHHASGKINDVLLNASVYKDAVGAVRGIFAAARDVTQTKQASRYARSLIEASPDPLVTISPEGKITDVNEATVRVTGVPREKLIGTDFLDYFSEPQKARETYTQVFKLGFVKDYPLTIRSTTGQLTDVLYNASVYKDDKGSVLGVFAAARDNTRAKQFAEQLETTNRDLESFSYSVSHDLRAPLRAIDGFSKILTDEYGKLLDDGGRKIIGTIRDSATHMGKLIDDLLAFSRLGRQQIKKASLNMKDLAAAVFDELKLANPSRDITLKLGPIADAFADTALMRQVWVNLLSNAIKFTGRQKAAKIEVSSKEENGFIIYTVKDNGVGFDMKYVGKLFEVFQRLHSAEEFQGTGVGLSILHRIVTKHGGKVWAEAKVGEGASFSFSLPSGKLNK